MIPLPYLEIVRYNRAVQSQYSTNFALLRFGLIIYGSSYHLFDKILTIFLRSCLNCIESGNTLCEVKLP